MQLIKMSSFRGTKSFLSVPVCPILIGNNNKKFRTIIGKNSKDLRIMASRGTKTIHIKKIQKNTVPKKTMFIVGNRGTKSSIIPITN